MSSKSRPWRATGPARGPPGPFVAKAKFPPSSTEPASRPQAIALDFNQTKQLIFAGHFLTTVFEIDVDGKKTRAIPRDYQLDPVRDFPIHVDFLRLAEGQAIKVVVPVHVVGQEKSPGVKRGGTLQIVEHTVELLVPSDAIPDFIEASVADLDIGSSVHLTDITLPKGAKATSAENVTLVTVVPPSGMKEEDAARPPKPQRPPRPGLRPERAFRAASIGFDAPTARPERFL